MADSDLDTQAMLTLGYGFYVVTSRKGERFNGQISNAIMQVTDTPPRLASAVNKDSLTHEFICDSGVFVVNVLSELMPMDLIRMFGFRSGRDTDKLSQVSYEIGSTTGCPVITDHAVACMEVRVETTLKCGTHTLFIGEVVGARFLESQKPMTYAYYREVLNGKTPPTAPTYRALGVVKTSKNRKGIIMDKYVCDVCGYVYDPVIGDPDNDVEPGTPFEDLPDGWVCPECGAGKDEFSLAE